MGCLLGCIADDFTGATDLANTLVNHGMRVVQTVGLPKANSTFTDDTDAVVVALKCRSIPPDAAARETTAALDWLQKSGCVQYFWKYCSTFDSTPQGNIGPVADALLDKLGEAPTIVCPAFPEAGRTVYQGHLFVFGDPLDESSMRDHPLNPMTDSSLLRLMGAQTSRKVGLIAWPTVRKGTEAVRDAIGKLYQQGITYVVTDALTNEDLLTIGSACADHRLVTGGSGIAMGLPSNFRASGLLEYDQSATTIPSIAGPTAILSGSCSVSTRTQVRKAQDRYPAYKLDPIALAEDREKTVTELVKAIVARIASSPVLVYAGEDSATIGKIHEKIGGRRAGELVEWAMGRIAVHLHENGVNRFVVAGGETSGAVVSALKIEALRIGPQIDPGVPWTVSIGNPKVALALKSGNFGTPDFFTKAIRMIDGFEGNIQ